jgi:hypothetical protein
LQGFRWDHLGDMARARFLGPGDADLQGRLESGSYSGREASNVYRLQPDAFERLQAIELSAYSDISLLDVPFEFRDVPVPKR